MSSQQPEYPAGVQPAYSTPSSSGPPKPFAQARMQRLTKVGVVSFAKVMGASGVLIGLIMGLIYGLILILVGIFSAVSGQQGSGAMGVAGIGVGLAMIVGFPIIYGAISFVVGLVYALVINLVLGFTGGLEIELQ